MSFVNMLCLRACKSARGCEEDDNGFTDGRVRNFDSNFHNDQNVVSSPMLLLLTDHKGAVAFEELTSSHGSTM